MVEHLQTGAIVLVGNLGRCIENNVKVTGMLNKFLEGMAPTRGPITAVSKAGTS